MRVEIDGRVNLGFDLAFLRRLCLLRVRLLGLALGLGLGWVWVRRVLCDTLRIAMILANFGMYMCGMTIFEVRVVMWVLVGLG